MNHCTRCGVGLDDHEIAYSDDGEIMCSRCDDHVRLVAAARRGRILERRGGIAAIIVSIPFFAVAIYLLTGMAGVHHISHRSGRTAGKILGFICAGGGAFLIGGITAVWHSRRPTPEEADTEPRARTSRRVLGDTNRL